MVVEWGSNGILQDLPSGYVKIDMEMDEHGHF